MEEIKTYTAVFELRPEGVFESTGGFTRKIIKIQDFDNKVVVEFAGGGKKTFFKTPGGKIELPSEIRKYTIFLN